MVNPGNITYFMRMCAFAHVRSKSALLFQPHATARPQHFLYFLPLPQGTVIAANAGARPLRVLAFSVSTWPDAE